MVKLGRKPTRQTAIAAQLRRQIIRGQWTAGQQIPSQVELAKRLGSPPLTVRRAIARLVDEEFLTARDRRGTFVRDRLPHEHHYALVVPHDPDTSPFWSRFYSGLVNVAATISQSGRGRIIPFYGMDYGAMAPDYQRLLTLVQSHRLAGIIFATYPFMHIGSPLLDQPGIPRVAIMTEARLPQVKAIALDGSFGAKAAQYLANRGRSRIAVVTTDMGTTTRELLPLLAARGMTTRPLWTMPVHHEYADGARVFTELLMKSRGEERPDGLIITDDNLAEHATAGLIAAGVRIGEELDAVVQCNFPWAGELPPQVQKIGYSLHEVLETSLQLLDRQRSGGTVPPVTTIEAKFEEELAAATMGMELSPV